MEQGSAQASAAPLRLEEGIIRGGWALIRVSGALPVPEQLRLAARGPAGGLLAVASLEPSDDRQGAFVARLDLRALPQAVMGITLEDAAGSPVTAQVMPAYELATLCCPDLAAFEAARLARKKRLRARDGETQRFQALQMLRQLPWSVGSRLTEAAMTMAATQAYRACEAEEAVTAADAQRRVEDVLSLIEGLPRSGWNDAMRISLLTARWHVAAIAGDRAAFTASLAAILGQRHDFRDNPEALLVYYNAVRSLCVLAGVHLLSGRVAEAQDALAAIIPAMQAAGARVDLRHAVAKEMGATFRLLGPVQFLMEALQAKPGLDAAAVVALPVSGLDMTVGDVARVSLIQRGIRTANAARLAGIITAWAADPAG